MDAASLRNALATDPATSGLFLDFDGTLTPIVDDPTSSKLPQRLREVLGDLAQRLGCVAVVSGRPATFLLDRLRVPGVRMLGLYGLEEGRDGEIDVRPEAAEWQSAVDVARDRLRTAVEGMDGVVLEDKGLSVAVHWRNAPDRTAAGEAVSTLVEEVAADTGLGREPGKLVEELRPPVAWDKGSAVRALTEELALSEPVYVGDDLGDLTAFAAVRELGGRAVAVDHGAETPSRLLEAADVVLPGNDAVADWLTELRAQLSP